jgi:hypothetical protein
MNASPEVRRAQATRSTPVSDLSLFSSICPTGLDLIVMKVTEKPVPTGVGIFFIGFALLAAALILPGAKQAQSPILYVCIFGGLFVGIAATLGIAVVIKNRRRPN